MPAPWGSPTLYIACNCDNKIQCFKCSGRHHLDSSNNNAGATVSPALHIGSGMHVFLRTTQVNVSIPGKELSHSLTVRAIFDTGAQQSYINQKVVHCKCLENENCQDRETKLQHLGIRTKSWLNFL